jgi:nitrite reductase/ring-hydroxylating ferredoxin subunit
MNKKALCHLNDIPENGSLGLHFDNAALFAVRANNTVYVYKNQCPHLGLPLEWQQHQFLSDDQTLIQCKTHGALFEKDTGKCVYGPCINDSLIKIDTLISNGVIYLVSNQLK